LKNSNIVVIILTLLIVISFSFGDIKENNEHFTIRFIDPLICNDNEFESNIALTYCQYDNLDEIEGWKTLNITMQNIYPNYVAKCEFTVKNIGEVNEIIEEYEVIDPTSELNWLWVNEYSEGLLWKDFDNSQSYEEGEEIILIMITDMKNIQLEPGEVKTGEIVFSISQNAEQKKAYYFEVKIIYGH
jgi:hypothetical protein